MRGFSHGVPSRPLAPDSLCQEATPLRRALLLLPVAHLMSPGARPSPLRDLPAPYRKPSAFVECLRREYIDADEYEPCCLNDN